MLDEVTLVGKFVQVNIERSADGVHSWRQSPTDCLFGIMPQCVILSEIHTKWSSPTNMLEYIKGEETDAIA